MEHTKNGVPLFNENNYALWKGRMEVYLLVQGYKVWDTVLNGFTRTTDEQGDSNVKEAKLQIYRAKFEQLRMKDDDNIAAYFQHIDEITNTLEGLGEPVDEKTIIRKILRMLPGRFNTKISVLEYSENLDKLIKEELHGVLIAYEMRLDEEEGTSHLETAFAACKKIDKEKQPSKEKTCTCTCKCEEKEDDEEGFSDGEYAYSMRKLKLGKVKIKGKVPLICFGCGEVGHFVAKCLNISNGNSKGKKGFKKFNMQGKKKGFKRNFLSKEDNSSSDEDINSEEEANERVLFMAKHNKQEVSNNEEEGLTIE
eukprot:PITA_13339